MTAQSVVVDVLLAAGVALAVAGSAGVLLMASPLDRLHYVTPVSVVSAVVVAAAVVVKESFDARGLKAILVAVTLLFLGPVLTQATARAARVEQHGGWRLEAGEKRRGRR